MKPRCKRNSKKSDTVLEGPQISRKKTKTRKKSSSTITSESVQCEMGTEVFKKFWTPPNHGTKENVLATLMEEDPLHLNADEEDTSEVILGNTKNSYLKPADKIDTSSSSNWTSALTPVTLEAENINVANTVGASGLTFKADGSGTMVIPLVLNLVDGSDTKDFVVVNLDSLPSNNCDSNVGTEVKIKMESQVDEDGVAEIKNGKKYTCADCGEVFGTIVPYENHCLTHNNVQPMQCSKCSRRFEHRQDLNRHEDSHAEECYTCSICPMSFTNHDALLAHTETHEKVLPSSKPSEDPMKISNDVFQCAQCEKTFSDADLLQRHEVHHTESELFPCDHCGRTFLEESHLVMHLKLHEKIQRCDTCDEVFTNIFDFNEHMITHKYDTNKIYKCLECKITFDSFYFLKKHASTHGMEVHWCGDCGGSGHLGSPESEMDCGETTSVSETSLLLKVGGDSADVKSEGMLEEDPLKIDDDSMSDKLVSDNIGEDLHIDVKVDNLVIKNENNSSLSDSETNIPEVVKAKVKSGKGKRRNLKRSAETMSELSLESPEKSMREN